MAIMMQCSEISDYMHGKPSPRYEAAVARLKTGNRERIGDLMFEQMQISEMETNLHDRRMELEELIAELDRRELELLSWQQELENCTDDNKCASSSEGGDEVRTRVRIGTDEHGKPLYKHVSGNTPDALQRNIVKAWIESGRIEEVHREMGLEPRQAQPMAETFVEAEDAPIFKDYAAEWMTTYKLSKCRPRTIAGYNSILNEHLYPAFGDMPVNQFDVRRIQAFLNERKDASAKYLKEMRQLLSQILECVKRDGYLKDNPAQDPRISIPSTRKKERTALTIEQLNEVLSVLDVLEGREQLYLALLIYTGMRRGEILGLRWEDIDLVNNVIHVINNTTYVNNQPIEGDPKTDSGTRDIPIMSPLLKYLLPLKNSGYVIENKREADKPITLTMFKTIFKHIQNAGNLYGATSHTFRHTMGTLLNDAGADVKTIQGILGQKDYKTTMERYVHPVEKRKHEAVEKMGGMLSSAD